MKWLLAPLVLGLWASPASGAPITWTFDMTLIVVCEQDGTTCPDYLQPYLPLHNSSVHGVLTFDSNAIDQHPDPKFGIYSMGRWTLDVTAFDTTWTSPAGSLEIGTVQAPMLGAFQCFGCMAAFGYFSQNSNPAAPPPPSFGGLPFEFRTFGPQFVTDALPLGLTSFQAAGGFFVGANDIVARPFEVHSVPEPGTVLFIASSVGMVLARRGLRRRRGSRSGPGR
jgi:hypothetical protein